MEMSQIISKQKSLFNTRITLDLDFRKRMLIKLENSIRANYQDILDSFIADLNKCEFDVLSTELLSVFEEIKYFKKNMKKLSKSKKFKSGMLNMFGSVKAVYNPLGCVLVVAPWNYPVQLALLPLVGAIAAGNTVVLKPSSRCPNISKALKKILSVFDDEYIYVLGGSREKNQNLFENKFDFIFFTGGQEAAKDLLQKCSQNLVPTLLELGGKSPCIVDSSANLKLAAKRIVWGKFLNAGQTCVAPDFVWVNKEIKEDLIFELKKQIREQFYEDGRLTKEFPYIVNSARVDNFKMLIDKEKLIVGGAVRGRLIEPTILDNITFDDEIMKQEIFGPILPIITFDTFSEVEHKMKSLAKPLGLYYFGSDKQNIQTIKRHFYFGGGCINDVVMQAASGTIPFGGVGESGMGAYHGKKSFEIFSHLKPLLFKGKRELNLKYSPRKKYALPLLKKWLKIKQ